jgi:hypothetical protein
MSPLKKRSVNDDHSNIEDHPLYKSIIKMHVNSPSVMVPVPSKSSPAKKDRKLPIKPF